MKKSNLTWIIIIGVMALGAFSILLLIGALALSDGGGFPRCDEQFSQQSAVALAIDSRILLFRQRLL